MKKEYWHGLTKAELYREKYLAQFYPKSDGMRQREEQEIKDLAKMIKERWDNENT